MKILVGSTAAKQHFLDFRLPKDVDFFSDTLKPDRNAHLEVFWQPHLLKYFKATEDRVATPDELYTIKVSHAFWELRNRSWVKHMKDVIFFQEHGCRLNQELYDILYDIWVERYGPKRANLNVTPEKFFTSTVARKYDHDSVHASVAYYGEPLFNAILKERGGVAVSKAKFEALSSSDKLRLVREEVYATALERILIPSDYTENPGRAYRWALQKLITSFSKGWFPLWVVLNFSDLISSDLDYVQKHLDNKDKLIVLEGKC